VRRLKGKPFMQMQQAIAPILRFETRAKQNPALSLEAGRPVFQDIDMLVITPPGTRDSFEAEASTWLAAKRNAAALGQYPLDWIEKFEAGYQRWKSGNEMPEDGWALKMCPAFTPAEIAACLSIDIKTVESLSQVQDTGLNMLGLNGRILRDRARALLSEGQDKGKLSMQIESMAADLQTTKESLKSAQEKITELEAALQAKPKLGLPRKEAA
jgi:hypothetical protein